MIHHITAICADPQVTTDFYARVLGLRLVKVTVNQDDVGTYHLYFGDKTGSPGSALTFFPWSNLPKGSRGPGMVSAVAFATPTLDFWEKRLAQQKVAVRKEKRFGETTLVFADPDGLQLELVAHPEQGNWSTPDVPTENAISRFYGATLCLDDYEQTAQLLTTYFNYVDAAQEGEWHRLQSPGSVIDLHEAPEARPGMQGHGTVHHIAFRAPTKDAQLRLRKQLLDEGLRLTPPIDRFYFTSVYFHEPGGVLFEIATDEPGFTVDEPEAQLGSKLVLPPRFEPHRREIEQLLPPFRFPLIQQ